MNAPDAAACKVYAGQAAASWDTAQLDQALAAEKRAQRRKCRVPADGAAWPEDLAEALMRRVMRNLAMRGIALGVQGIGEGVAYIGGKDPEVNRLEAPFRKLRLG